MTQRDLNRAVAKATGENLRVITQLGFTLADPVFVEAEPEPFEEDIEAKIIEWDEFDQQRNVPLVPQRSAEPVLV